MQNFKKYDAEKELILLDGKYFFAFSKGEGFTERLLSMVLLIDYEYNYEFEMSMFEREHFVEKGKAPKNMQNYLEALLSSNFSQLKRAYDHTHPGSTGHGISHQYLINFEVPTNNIYIAGEPSEDYFETDAEKILFAFDEFLKEWTGNKFESWIPVATK